MNIVIAIDSFKGSISSMEAGLAAAEGFRRVIPHANIDVKPVADGGEGTVAALVEGLQGEYRQVRVQNPLSEETTAEYGIVGDTAVMEMSAAAGIALIPKENLNPMVTTTYGVGQMILDAISSGCRKFIIGIGGSATNDGGVGMLQALGFEFLDKDGKSVPAGAAGLPMITQIKTANALPQLSQCEFHIACDVENPLCGPNGCTYIYSPQKGASPEQLPVMDKSMAHYAACTKKVLPHADEGFPGAGAAGGLGFAFKTYLNASLTSGISLILDKIGMEDAILDADLVITGEGKIDHQTVMGKAPIGIAKLAKKHGKPVIAFAGCVTPDAAVCNNHGIDAIFSIVNAPCTLEDAMNTENAKENMTNCAHQVANLFYLNNRK